MWSCRRGPAEPAMPMMAVQIGCDSGECSPAAVIGGCQHVKWYLEYGSGGLVRAPRRLCCSTGIDIWPQPLPQDHVREGCRVHMPLTPAPCSAISAMTGRMQCPLLVSRYRQLWLPRCNSRCRDHSAKPCTDSRAIVQQQRLHWHGADGCSRRPFVAA
jgi:hypothetical protein